MESLHILCNNKVLREQPLLHPHAETKDAQAP